MIVSLGLINGLVFGIEHMSADKDDDFVWVIVVQLAIFRFCFTKF